ncbi:PREDICTED: chaperone protein DnaJ-like isoform X1 [Brassica oleracea var. oleracea]|uniref:chaperone protein DnaJ-like isoform X1 n=1 Tax=Brassica oleracea var. oleracea TaxID=109376 RepID=UPI0006A71B48|nr:PREDICTED: chaperone protein DnaJ-like isoform X1 [Brassica oleracea var. oleracea]XP_013621979.1 PREDICTED: chaperone protein DnaJ-like isoform X1 [Brassica oleracea var. oleracea]XP_013621982.1 PREDICTED: chaperone protein DnaJ-like isoform X1 [Brassica oleracea var. oleracea]
MKRLFLCSSLHQMEDNNSPKKDYYKILEVDYDATEEMLKLNYRKLALKWHPDKHNGDTMATSKFQEINEAYNVLMDPDLRFEYDLTGIYEIHKYTLREYLARFKGMILTCNGLGISHSSSPWTQQLAEGNITTDEQGFDLASVSTETETETELK